MPQCFLYPRSLKRIFDDLPMYMNNMNMSEAISVRMATTNDKLDILAINEDVYEGCDYLPMHFDVLMSDERYIPRVAVFDGQIVGFELSFVNESTEDGKAEITSCANRVAEEFQGIGVMKKLKDAMEEELETLFPGHRTLVLARTPTDYWTAQVSSGKWKILQAWGVYKSSTSLKQHEVKSMIHNQLDEFNPVFSNTHMQDVEQSKQLVLSLQKEILTLISTFGNYLICGNPWFGQQALALNIIPLLEKEIFLVSLSKENAKITGLSINSPYFARVGSVNHVFFYGTSIAVAILHLITHLKLNLEGHTCDVLIYFHFPASFEMNDVESAMDKIFRGKLKKDLRPEGWLLQKEVGGT